MCTRYFLVTILFEHVSQSIDGEDELLLVDDFAILLSTVLYELLTRLDRLRQDFASELIDGVFVFRKVYSFGDI